MIYDHITYIGFRMHEDPGHGHDPKEQESYFRFKFISYTAYLMISVYYNYHYAKRITATIEEQEFSEKEYAKLFEFSNEEEERRSLGKKMFGNIQKNSQAFRRDRKSRKSMKVDPSDPQVMEARKAQIEEQQK